MDRLTKDSDHGLNGLWLLESSVKSVLEICCQKSTLPNMDLTAADLYQIVKRKQSREPAGVQKNDRPVPA
jgi:hypothetical protein